MIFIIDLNKTDRLLQDWMFHVVQPGHISSFGSSTSLTFFYSMKITKYLQEMSSLPVDLCVYELTKPVINIFFSVQIFFYNGKNGIFSTLNLKV